MSRSCRAMGREGEGFPAWNHLLGYVSHVLLSFVPTANFIVYCLVGNKFRYCTLLYCTVLYCTVCCLYSL